MPELFFHCIIYAYLFTLKITLIYTNKTNKSWEVVYVIEKVRQLFSKHMLYVGLVVGGTDRIFLVCYAVE